MSNIHRCFNPPPTLYKFPHGNTIHQTHNSIKYIPILCLFILSICLPLSSYTYHFHISLRIFGVWVLTHYIDVYLCSYFRFEIGPTCWHTCYYPIICPMWNAKWISMILVDTYAYLPILSSGYTRDSRLINSTFPTINAQLYL